MPHTPLEALRLAAHLRLADPLRAAALEEAARCCRECLLAAEGCGRDGAARRRHQREAERALMRAFQPVPQA